MSASGPSGTSSECAFCQSGIVTEQPLRGGISHQGAVVRSGRHVLRPSGPHTDSVHAFLRALAAQGFDGAPEAVGVDPDGRERLEFIDGDVPLVPYPEWSQSDEALASLARLLRRFHDASASFDPAGFTWNRALADPVGGSVVCHNDVELSNVVFRNGEAVALIDFEFAAPGRPVYDLAQLARVCVPIDHEVDRARMGWLPSDAPARLRLVADAYGLDRSGRAELLPALVDAIGRVDDAVRRTVEAGERGAVELWKRSGGDERFERRRRWLQRHHDDLVAALA